MATRFQSLPDQEIREIIASLVRQIGTGTAQVSINGIMTVYSTPANIRIAIAEFEAELVDRAVASIGSRRRSPLAAQYPLIRSGKGYL